ncbi:MAG: hypothetical protein WBC70_18810 [Candidatus Aminicenantales bacterium]
MFERLEKYLEEISHFLSGREEREEILTEIRSHILEKAEQEFGEITESSLDQVIAAYGAARRVAEKYLDGHEIIAPAYRRFLFRYTALLFAFHFILSTAAVIFKKSFILFPVLYVPSLDPLEFLFYLPTAFLFDLGIVTLVLYLITQSNKEVKLPWPRISIDLDEVKKPGATVGRVFGLIAMAIVTGLALYLYLRHGTIFFVNFGSASRQPLLTPEAGQLYSLLLIGLLALSTIALALKLVKSSPWVDAVQHALSLVLVGLAFRHPFDTAIAVPLPEAVLRTTKYTVTISLLVLSVFIAVDLVKALVRIGRKRLAK